MRDIEHASTMLEARVAEAREAGVPLVFEDLAYRLDVPESENAFPELKRAFELLGSHEERSDLLEALSAALEQSDFQRFDELIAPKQEILELAASASRQVYSRNDSTDWEYPSFGELGATMFAKDVVTLLGLRAQCMAKRDVLEAAIHDIQTAHRIAGLVNQEPFVIGGLIAIAVFAVNNAFVRRILAMQMDQGRPVGGLARALVDGAQPPSWEWIVRSEVFFAVQGARNFDHLGGMDSISDETLLSETGPPRPSAPARTTELPTDLLTRAMFARTLECYAAAFRGFNALGWDPLATRKLIYEAEQSVDKEDGDSYRHVKSSWSMYGSTALALVNCLASHELVKAYGEVLEFRQREGRWPESLPEAGVHALDPFDQQPLRYRIDGVGMRIWSIGRNLVDNGGVTSAEALNFLDCDNVIGYPPLQVRKALYLGTSGKDA